MVKALGLGDGIEDLPLDLLLEFFLDPNLGIDLFSVVLSEIFLIEPF